MAEAEHGRRQVVIIGAGPAGSAAALALRRAGIDQLVIVEAGHLDNTRVGESIPPDTRLLLQELEVWRDFEREGHEICYGSCSSWGHDDLGYNDFITNPHGNGFHLDRLRFDRFMAGKAEQAGAELYRGLRFEQAAALPEGGYRLRLLGEGKNDRFLDARYVIDAGGTAARFARKQGARRIEYDKLICVTGFFQLPEQGAFSRLTMLEAVENGWWYAAKLPNRRLAAAFAGDPDYIQEYGLRDKAAWHAALKTTRHLAPALGDTPLLDEALLSRPVSSSVLDTPAGKDWLAAGDAASTYDPISSQGIYKALSDGLAAGRAIASALQGDQTQLQSWPDFIAGRFREYLSMRDHFYSLERRWPESAFWKRRRQTRSADESEASA